VHKAQKRLIFGLLVYIFSVFLSQDIGTSRCKKVISFLITFRKEKKMKFWDSSFQSICPSTEWKNLLTFQKFCQLCRILLQNKRCETFLLSLENAVIVEDLFYLIQWIEKFSNVCSDNLKVYLKSQNFDFSQYVFVIFKFMHVQISFCISTRERKATLLNEINVKNKLWKIKVWLHMSFWSPDYFYCFL